MTILTINDLKIIREFIHKCLSSDYDIEMDWDEMTTLDNLEKYINAKEGRICTVKQ